MAIHWWPALNTQAPGAAAASLAGSLAPAEQAALAQLSALRRRDEYARSRYLARWLTGSTAPLLRTSSGEPTWPPGHTGSITHKDGHVGVALADPGRARSVGIDAEDTQRVKSELAPRLVRSGEWELLQRLAASTGQAATHWLAVAFSFKEALFKSHFPAGRTMFYFHDAEITSIDVGAATITATLHVTTSPLTPAGTSVGGHFLIRPEESTTLVLTSVVLPGPS